MGNTYKDDHGHFTSKENDGGACHHDGNGGGSHKTADTNKAIDKVFDIYKDAPINDIAEENGKWYISFQSESDYEDFKNAAGDNYNKEYSEASEYDANLYFDDEQDMINVLQSKFPKAFEGSEDADYEKDLMQDDEISLDKKKRIWDLWDKSVEYMQKDMDAENIERFNAANEEFADEVTLLFDPDKNPDKIDEFYEIMDAAKSPDDIEEFLRENIGERPEKWQVELEQAMHIPDLDEERGYGPDELSDALEKSFTDDFVKILRSKAEELAEDDEDLARIRNMDDGAVIGLLADPDEGIGPGEIKRLAIQHNGVDKSRFRDIVEGEKESLDIDDRYEDDIKDDIKEDADDLYIYLVRDSEDNTVEYGDAKYYIANEGPGLSERLSKPDKDLSDRDRYIKNAVNSSAKPSKRQLKLYRTDSVNWLGDAKEGDVKDMRFLVNASLNDMTIKENEGKVKQKIHINIKPGDPILAINNDDEKEVDVINKDERYAFKIMSKSVGSDGIPTYEVELTEKK